MAKNKINILCKHIQIAGVNKNVVFQALQNPSVNDFEDGLEYYAAIDNKCDCIITEDIDDFYFAEIEVLQSEAFFDKYLVGDRKQSKK